MDRYDVIPISNGLADDAPNRAEICLNGRECELIFWPRTLWERLAAKDRPGEARALSGGAYYLIRPLSPYSS